MNWSLVVASNSDEVLRSTLLSSPDLQASADVLVQRGFPSASAAYNDGIYRTEGEIIIFPHQDVYLPAGWIAALSESVAWLNSHDPDWAVAGVFGIDAKGVGKGWVYSTGLRSIVGQGFDRPAPVRSLDELILIVRRSAGVFFDEKLPGFHLYGTDICLEAARRGCRAYVLPCFCIHNANGIRFLPWSYWKSFIYMRRKWRRELPIVTPCMTISPWGWPAVRYIIHRWLLLVCGRVGVGTRVQNPAQLYSTLTAYEK